MLESSPALPAPGWPVSLTRPGRDAWNVCRPFNRAYGTGSASPATGDEFSVPSAQFSALRVARGDASASEVDYPPVPSGWWVGRQDQPCVWPKGHL